MATILLTGSTGYIGHRLLSRLLLDNHKIICCLRDVRRFRPPKGSENKISLLEIDFLYSNKLPDGIVPDVAFYLIHSMNKNGDYSDDESRCAENFSTACAECQQVIYLSGIVNEEVLSPHLRSRLAVEKILSEGKFSLTVLRAGIIIGSGSASYEIIRDLVEKLPIMITPKWLNTYCQPIGIREVLDLLVKSILNSDLYNHNFDIGGKNILTYRDMLLGYARVRGLKRYILTVPIMTPRLSSYWLYFVTSTAYQLAVNLVDSMKVKVICRDQILQSKLGVNPTSYEESLMKALQVSSLGKTPSSWHDSLISGGHLYRLDDLIEVPKHGCFCDSRSLKSHNIQGSISKIFRIGGNNGWYAGNYLWKIRGFIDKLCGGVGLRRGRRDDDNLEAGDTLDFWRVIKAQKEQGYLLLFAEMKLPGEAWLEFQVEGDFINQSATFRPRGLLGRIYWWCVLPLHGYIFSRMLKKIAQ